MRANFGKVYEENGYMYRRQTLQQKRLDDLLKSTKDNIEQMNTVMQQFKVVTNGVEEGVESMHQQQSTEFQDFMQNSGAYIEQRCNAAMEQIAKDIKLSEKDVSRLKNVAKMMKKNGGKMSRTIYKFAEKTVKKLTNVIMRNLWSASLIARGIEVGVMATGVAASVYVIPACIVGGSLVYAAGRMLYVNYFELKNDQLYVMGGKMTKTGRIKRIAKVWFALAANAALQVAVQKLATLAINAAIFPDKVAEPGASNVCSDTDFLARASSSMSESLQTISGAVGGAVGGVVDGMVTEGSSVDTALTLLLAGTQSIGESTLEVWTVKGKFAKFMAGRLSMHLSDLTMQGVAKRGKGMNISYGSGAMAVFLGMKQSLSAKPRFDGDVLSNQLRALYRTDKTNSRVRNLVAEAQYQWRLLRAYSAGQTMSRIGMAVAEAMSLVVAYVLLDWIDEGAKTFMKKDDFLFGMAKSTLTSEFLGKIPGLHYIPMFFQYLSAKSSSMLNKALFVERSSAWQGKWRYAHYVIRELVWLLHTAIFGAVIYGAQTRAQGVVGVPLMRMSAAFAKGAVKTTTRATMETAKRMLSPFSSKEPDTGDNKDADGSTNAVETPSDFEGFNSLFEDYAANVRMWLDDTIGGSRSSESQVEQDLRRSILNGDVKAVLTTMKSKLGYSDMATKAAEGSITKLVMQKGTTTSKIQAIQYANPIQIAHSNTVHRLMETLQLAEANIKITLDAKNIEHTKIAGYKFMSGMDGRAELAKAMEDAVSALNDMIDGPSVLESLQKGRSPEDALRNLVHNMERARDSIAAIQGQHAKEIGNEKFQDVHDREVAILNGQMQNVVLELNKTFGRLGLPMFTTNAFDNTEHEPVRKADPIDGEEKAIDTSPVFPNPLQTGTDKESILKEQHFSKDINNLAKRKITIEYSMFSENRQAAYEDITAAYLQFLNNVSTMAPLMTDEQLRNFEMFAGDAYLAAIASRMHNVVITNAPATADQIAEIDDMINSQMQSMTQDEGFSIEAALDFVGAIVRNTKFDNNNDDIDQNEAIQTRANNTLKGWRTQLPELREVANNVKMTNSWVKPGENAVFGGGDLDKKLVVEALRDVENVPEWLAEAVAAERVASHQNKLKERIENAQTGTVLQNAKDEGMSKEEALELARRVTDGELGIMSRFTALINDIYGETPVEEGSADAESSGATSGASGAGQSGGKLNEISGWRKDASDLNDLRPDAYITEQNGSLSEVNMDRAVPEEVTDGMEQPFMGYHDFMRRINGTEDATTEQSAKTTTDKTDTKEQGGEVSVGEQEATTEQTGTEETKTESAKLKKDAEIKELVEAMKQVSNNMEIKKMLGTNEAASENFLRDFATIIKKDFLALSNLAFHTGNMELLKLRTEMTHEELQNALASVLRLSNNFAKMATAASKGESKIDGEINCAVGDSRCTFYPLSAAVASYGTAAAAGAAVATFTSIPSMVGLAVTGSVYSLQVAGAGLIGLAEGGMGTGLAAAVASSGTVSSAATTVGSVAAATAGVASDFVRDKTYMTDQTAKEVASWALSGFQRNKLQLVDNNVLFLKGVMGGAMTVSDLNNIFRERDFVSMSANKQGNMRGTNIKYKVGSEQSVRDLINDYQETKEEDKTEFYKHVPEKLVEQMFERAALQENVVRDILQGLNNNAEGGESDAQEEFRGELEDRLRNAQEQMKLALEMKEDLENHSSYRLRGVLGSTVQLAASLATNMGSSVGMYAATGETLPLHVTDERRDSYKQELFDSLNIQGGYDYTTAAMSNVFGAITGGIRAAATGIGNAAHSIATVDISKIH